MERRSTRRSSRVKLEASLSPPPSDALATVSSVVREEVTDLNVHVKVESTPAKPRKRKRKGEADPKEPPPLKREARYRKSCPKTVMDRMERVLSQRMFMVHRSGVDSGSGSIRESFNMLGSTGNIYTVNMGAKPSCDCPDNLKGNSPCKHILFIFSKVLKVPQTSDLWYQKALLPDELTFIYASAPASTEALASEAVQKAFRKATSGADGSEESTAEASETKNVIEGELVDESGPGGRRLTTIGDDCPICFEEMTRQDLDSGRLVFDISVGGCGKPLHDECFRMWSSSAKSRGTTSTCVWCRAPWAAPPPQGEGGVAHTRSGYMNMASIAGMSGVRDTSTYHHHFVKGGKGKTWADVYAEGDELV